VKFPNFTEFNKSIFKIRVPVNITANRNINANVKTTQISNPELIPELMKIIGNWTRNTWQQTSLTINLLSCKEIACAGERPSLK